MKSAIIRKIKLRSRSKVEEENNFYKLASIDKACDFLISEERQKEQKEANLREYVSVNKTLLSASKKEISKEDIEFEKKNNIEYLTTSSRYLLSLKNSLTENRHFFQIIIEGEAYSALLDSGATVTTIGSKLIKNFRNRLRSSSKMQFIKGIAGITPVLGILYVNLNVNGNIKMIEMYAINGFLQNYDCILGMDFCQKWDIDTKLGRGLWRTCGSKWKKFYNFQENEEATLYAECIKH